MFDSARVDAAIRDLVDRQHLAGVSVCVQGPDGPVFEGCYGVRDVAMTQKVDAETMFGIASMSKSITALALCLMEQEGKLSLDDPVAKFLPNFRVPGAPSSAVTLRHLAMHTAGIPPMEPLEWSIARNSHRRETPWLLRMRAEAPNDMRTIDQIIDYIAHCAYTPVGAPGEHMSYCNEGYAILSYVADQAAGMKLEDYCDARIFRPLGMTRTVMDDACEKARPLSQGKLSALFERENGETIADETWSILPPFRGCATVKSTARDMATYYRCLSLYGCHEGKQVWPREAVERLIGREHPALTQDVYCLGLYKFARLGHVFCEHAGGLHGVSSKGALLLGEGYGFAVLCNQGDEDMDDILWTLYSAVLGLPLDTCYRRFAPVERAFPDPEMVVGDYTGHEGVPEHVHIRQEGGSLVGWTDSKRFTLRYCGATRFLGYKDAEAKTPCIRLEFFIRNGQSWGVRVGSRIFGRDEENVAGD